MLNLIINQIKTIQTWFISFDTFTNISKYSKFFTKLSTVQHQLKNYEPLKSKTLYWVFLNRLQQQKKKVVLYLFIRLLQHKCIFLELLHATNSSPPINLIALFPLDFKVIIIIANIVFTLIPKWVKWMNCWLFLTLLHLVSLTKVNIIITIITIIIGIIIIIKTDSWAFCFYGHFCFVLIFV